MMINSSLYDSERINGRDYCVLNSNACAGPTAPADISRFLVGCVAVCARVLWNDLVGRIALSAPSLPDGDPHHA